MLDILFTVVEILFVMFLMSKRLIGIVFIYVILSGLPLLFFNIAQDEYSGLGKYADWLINLFYNKVL